jgi:hypothetical protein
LFSSLFFQPLLLITLIFKNFLSPFLFPPLVSLHLLPLLSLPLFSIFCPFLFFLFFSLPFLLLLNF